MSHVKEDVSDDEFQDALSDTVSEKLKEEAIEELIRKQNDLKLPDEETDDTEADGATSIEIPQEDIVDTEEQELLERERNLSEEKLAQNKEKALQLKLEGNDLFKNDSVDRSIEVYTEALHICPSTSPKDRAVLYGNRAAAKIKLGSKKSAIEDCTKAIELWPEYVRAILRRAKLYEYEEKLEEALEDYKRAYEVDPGIREAREAMVRLPPIIQERHERMKDEMMGKLKDLGNMFLKPFGLSTSNFQMQQDPNTGSYSVNFNQNSS